MFNQNQLGEFREFDSWGPSPRPSVSTPALPPCGLTASQDGRETGRTEQNRHPPKVIKELIERRPWALWYLPALCTYHFSYIKFNCWISAEATKTHFILHFILLESQTHFVLSTNTPKPNSFLNHWAIHPSAKPVNAKQEEDDCEERRRPLPSLQTG